MEVYFKTLQQADYQKLCAHLLKKTKERDSADIPQRRLTNIGNIELCDGVNLLYHDVRIEIGAPLSLKKAFKELSDIF